MNTKSQLDEKIVYQLKSWEWDFIIHFGLNHIGKLKGKGSQYNWLRGDMVEDVIGTQDDTLEFVGENHKDFHWHLFDISLECKSLLNNSMYDRRGRLKDSYKVKLCSLRSKRPIKESEVCDIILVVMKDGSFIIPKEAAIKWASQKGQQVDIEIDSQHIIEISGAKNLSKTVQKIDSNERVKRFKKMWIDEARKDFYRKSK